MAVLGGRSAARGPPAQRARAQFRAADHFLNHERLVPELVRLARRTMRVVKLNLGFTAAYNVVGLSLAALGFLPPILAAAAQGLPDLGILANSARLLRVRRSPPAPSAPSRAG